MRTADLSAFLHRKKHLQKQVQIITNKAKSVRKYTIKRSGCKNQINHYLPSERH